jgi:3-oxoacyl-[acyl-carrier-protein] synthase-3
MPNSIITATGSYIPNNRVPNTHFLQSSFFDANGNRNPLPNPEIIKKLHEITGIRERRCAPSTGTYL